MRHDVVMMALLMARMQHCTLHDSWADVLACPELNLGGHQGCGRLPVIPALDGDGDPRGEPMLLSQDQAAFTVLLHAAGYPRFTAHSCTTRGPSSGMLVEVLLHEVALTGKVPHKVCAIQADTLSAQMPRLKC